MLHCVANDLTLIKFWRKICSCFDRLAVGISRCTDSVVFIWPVNANSCQHRYLIYTGWCIPHCGQAKIEAGSQTLVVPTELIRSMNYNLCILYCKNGQS